MKRTYVLAAVLVAVLAVFAMVAPDPVSAGVALAAMPFAVIMNDASAIEDLQNRLLDLGEQANNIKARAEAEKRDLTDDEKGELQKIFAVFEATEEDIEARQKIEAINGKLAAPTGRRTDPDGEAPEQPQNHVAQNPHATRAQLERPARNTVPAQPRSTDTGKWGFRSAAEYMNAVMRASSKGGLTDPRLIANAPTTFGTEGVGQDGGFAVPPDFRTEILRKVMGEESLLSRTDQLTTSGNSITFPTDTTTPWDATGGIQANWESEGGQIAQSKPLLGTTMIKANKLTALVPVSEELVEDAAAMTGYVNSRAPEKMDYKVNHAIINGSGVGQPLGILSSAGTVVVAAESGQTPDTVVYDNIVNMWTRLAAAARRNAVWLANSDIEGQLMRMAFPGTGTAVPVYLPPGGLSGAPYGTLLGRPVITTEAMPALGDAGDLILGDMRQYTTLVKAGGIRSDVSIHLWFDYDVMAFRFIMRVGGQPRWNGEITRPAGQPTRGFFVALGARA